MNVTTVVSTDLVTPLGAYLRLRHEAGASFLLESVERGRLGRHSFVGCGSRLVDLAEAETCGEPVVGYVGYDYAATLEPTVPLPDDGRGLPESRFVVADTLIRFDHVLGLAEVLRGDPDAIGERLDGALPPMASRNGHVHGQTRRFPGRFGYERSVEHAKRAIQRGDAFQIVVSQRAERPTPVDALSLYRSLRRVNPSPYLFLLMLVDLGRNDLSRVCRPGTVHVERFLEPERFSHVTHLVSEVAGELQDGVGSFDLLRACFPAGTVSGAPK